MRPPVPVLVPVPVAEVRGSPRPPPLRPPPTPTLSATLSATLSSTPPPSETPVPPTPPPLPPVQPLAHVLCDVCCEHVPSGMLRGCASCSHRYCSACVDKYWTGAIYSGNHARLLCMYGGCGVFATDDDIASVVSARTFRKMLYFRSRDRFQAWPDARWCARDMCWEYLGRFSPTVMTDPVVVCPQCTGSTCVKCERLVSTDGAEQAGRHVCASRKPNKAHSALFGLWATLHTKSCPACAARIQRNHGCSHMTCTRCSSYFCWRCKGFLNNGCPLPGRACICDRVMTAAAYSGLAVATVIGSPLIVSAVLIGGGPYVAYRIVKARRDRARARLSPADLDHSMGYTIGIGGHHRAEMAGLGIGVSMGQQRRLVRGPGRMLQSDEMVVHDDDDFDGSYHSGSTRLTAFSDVIVTEARGVARPARRLRVQLQTRPGGEGGRGIGDGTEGKEEENTERSVFVMSREESELFGDSSGTFDSTGSIRDGVTGAAGVGSENCRIGRTVLLERRMGSVNGTRVRRAVV